MQTPDLRISMKKSESTTGFKIYGSNEVNGQKLSDTKEHYTGALVVDSSINSNKIIHS